jgi:CRP-like cAMP-binding protein
MKNKLKIDKVTSYHVEAFQNFTKPCIYNTESELIYEGQIPHAGYLLLEGEIHFIKRKTIIQKILPGTLFGVSELMNRTPLKFTVKILPNSKVCILDRSTVYELLEELQSEELPGTFQELA